MNDAELWIRKYLKASSCGLLSCIIKHIIMGMEDKQEKRNLGLSTLLLRT